MKTKNFFNGLTLFVVGMIVMFGIEASGRHHNGTHAAGARKSAVIEVGAPLSVNEMQHLGLN